MAANLRGKWTVPGKPVPSSHLIVYSVVGGQGVFAVAVRCGRRIGFAATGPTTDEPPATGKTCETCLRYSRRDG